jgi:DNA-binding LytR/AlgR family response regulator
MKQNKDYVIYADTRGGCQSICTMVVRSVVQCEPQCFHEKDELQAYLLDLKSGSKGKGRRSSLLFYKLLVDDFANVAFARRICDEYHHLPVIFVMDHICYVYLLFNTERQYYLWPPFSKERVTQAIEQLLLRRPRPLAATRSIIIANRVGNDVVAVDDIIYCESMKRVAYFYTKNGVSKMYIKLGEVEAKLPEYFIRCHQSFLVNFHCIKRVGKADVEMDDGTVIPVSQRKRRKVIGALEALERGEML